MSRRVGNKHVQKVVGSRIKEIRETVGLSQAAIADLVGISSPTVSRIESGIMAPTLDTLKMLSDALNVPLYTLFQNIGDPVPKPTIDYVTRREAALLKKVRLIGSRKFSALLTLLGLVENDEDDLPEDV